MAEICDRKLFGFRGIGLLLEGSETNVDVLKCAVKECGGTGMFVKGGPLDFNVGQPAP